VFIIVSFRKGNWFDANEAAHSNRKRIHAAASLRVARAMKAILARAERSRAHNPIGYHNS